MQRHTDDPGRYDGVHPEIVKLMQGVVLAEGAERETYTRRLTSRLAHNPSHVGRVRDIEFVLTNLGEMIETTRAELVRRAEVTQSPIMLTKENG